MKRLHYDKSNLDIFWLKDESLEDLENLPNPDVLAKKIADNFESGLELSTRKQIFDKVKP